MQTRFPKLRRRIAFAAVVAPLLVFVSVLCFAAGLGWWVAVPVVLAAILLAAFPYEGIDDDPPKPGGKFSRLMEYFSTLLFLLWLVSQQEFSDLLDRAESAIWDWRLLLGAFAWSAGWGYANFCKVRALEDRDIMQIRQSETDTSSS